MTENPADILRHAVVVKEFMKSESGLLILARLERRYYEEFKASQTSEERVRSWAKANVLADFNNEMLSIVGAGERVVLEADAKARHPKPTSRS